MGRQRLPVSRDRSQAQGERLQEPHSSPRCSQQPPLQAPASCNTTRSRVRARVEHVFADQENGMDGKLVRTIGMVRAA